MTTTLQTREVAIREVASDERTFTGLAVPWDDEIEIGGLRESFAPGSVRAAENVLVLYRHGDPIGRVTDYRDTPEGWEVTGRLSTTPAAEEAYTLLRDGVIDRMSIGFEPVAHEDTRDADGVTTIRHTEALVREVSLVPFPAYDRAAVTQVRAQTEPQEAPTMTTTTIDPQITELRENLEALERRVEVTLDQTPTTTAPEFRSYGDYVKRVASGEEVALRAYAGATTGDAVVKDAWLGSLVRILAEKQRVKNLFTTGTLPATGMGVEYAVLASDTTQVAEQLAEGDDLLFGKVAIDIASAPVKTFGGWSSLSRQAIERSNVGILDTTFTAMAVKYARAVELYARTVLAAGVAAADPLTVDLSTQDGVIEAILDVVEEFDERDMTLTGLLVSKDVFLGLVAVPATDRILQVSGAPTDKTGTVTISSAEAGLAGVKVTLLPSAAPGTKVAYDAAAIKTLESGGPLRLQDENVVNLTRDFSVYGYAASFVQQPAGLLRLED